MIEVLKVSLEHHFSADLLDCELLNEEITLHVASESILLVCKQLRDDFGYERWC